MVNRQKIIEKTFPGVWLYDQVPWVYKVTFIQFSPIESNKQSAWSELRELINIYRGSETFICICACWQQGWKVNYVHVPIHIRSLKCAVINKAHVHIHVRTRINTDIHVHIPPALQRQMSLWAMYWISINIHAYMFYILCIFKILENKRERAP